MRMNHESIDLYRIITVLYVCALQNCVRHSLSSSVYFSKLKKSQFEQKGFKWKIYPEHSKKLELEIDNYKSEERKLRINQTALNLSTCNEPQPPTPEQLASPHHNASASLHTPPPAGGTGINLSASRANLKMRSFCEETGVDEPSLTMQLEEFISEIHDDKQPEQNQPGTEETPNNSLLGHSNDHPIEIPHTEVSNNKDGSIQIPVDKSGRCVLGQVITNAASAMRSVSAPGTPCIVRISDIAPHLFTTTSSGVATNLSYEAQKSTHLSSSNSRVKNDETHINLKSGSLSPLRLPSDLQSFPCVKKFHFTDVLIGDYLHVEDLCSEWFGRSVSTVTQTSDKDSSDEDSQNASVKADSQKELLKSTPSNTSVMEALNSKFEDNIIHQSSSANATPEVSGNATTGKTTLPEIILGKLWGSCIADNNSSFELLVGSIVEVETSHLDTSQEAAIDSHSESEAFGGDTCLLRSSTPTKGLNFKVHASKDDINVSPLKPDNAAASDDIILSNESHELFDFSNLSAVSLADNEKSALINASFSDSHCKVVLNRSGSIARSQSSIDEEHLLDSSVLSDMLASTSKYEVSTLEGHQLLDASISKMPASCSTECSLSNTARNLASNFQIANYSLDLSKVSGEPLKSNSSQLLLFDKQENLLQPNKLFPGLSEEEEEEEEEGATAMMYSSDTLGSLASTVNKDVETLDLHSFSNWWKKLQF